MMLGVGQPRGERLVLRKPVQAGPRHHNGGRIVLGWHGPHQCNQGERTAPDLPVLAPGQDRLRPSGTGRPPASGSARRRGIV